MTRTPGVYVIEFPGHIKIGRAGDLRWRLREHAQAGAQRIRAFPMDGPRSYLGGRSWDVENKALSVAAVLGQRLGPGRTENFAGLTFDLASTITGIAAVHAGAAPVETYEVDINQLLACPTRLTRIIEREGTK